MGFTNNYPLLIEVISRISNIQDSEFESNVNNSWKITGPEFLRIAIEETNDSITLYPSVTFCPVHHTGEIAENWKTAEIYSLQYWNSTYRTIGSKEKRKHLDDTLNIFLQEYRKIN